MPRIATPPNLLTRARGNSMVGVGSPLRRELHRSDIESYTDEECTEDNDSLLEEIRQAVQESLSNRRENALPQTPRQDRPYLTLSSPLGGDSPTILAHSNNYDPDSPFSSYSPYGTQDTPAQMASYTVPGGSNKRRRTTRSSRAASDTPGSPSDPSHPRRDL